MPNFVDALITSIKRGRAEDVARAFDNAGFVFEKGRGLEPDGWPPELLTEDLFIEDVERVKLAIVSFLERFPDHAHAAAAINAIGQLQDKSLVPFFRALLERHLDGSVGPLSAVMIALDDLGEELFKKGTDYSGYDVDAYRELARAYLKRKN